MSVDIEKEFLSKLLTSKNDITQALEKRVELILFQEATNKKLFEIVLWFYNKYSSLISASMLQSILAKSKIEEDSKQKIILLYTELIGKTYEDRPLAFLIDEIKHDFKNAELKRMLISSVNSLEEKKLDQAIADLKSGIVKLDLTGHEDVREGFLDESADERFTHYCDVRDNPDKYKGIHIGWPSFDSVTNGVRGGQLMVIIGGVKEGKSAALTNIGYYAHAVQNKNVLYVSVEMPKIQVERRYDARDSGLSCGKIRDGKLSPGEELIYKQTIAKQKARPGKFYVIDAHDCSTSLLKSKLTTFPHKFDLVVLDYLTLVTPMRRGKDQWETIGKVTEEVRAIARELNIPIITAAQANREGIKENKRYKYGVENVGLSHLITAHADILLSLRLVDRDELEINDVVEMTAATIAIRDDKGCRFTIDACFDKMLMQERSISLSSSSIMSPFASSLAVAENR